MARLKQRHSSLNWEDDPKPMDGVANLSDAMLVFACGLMISIAVNWNIDLKVRQVELTNDQKVSEDVFNEIVSDSEDENVYEEMGKVYMDPDTGDLYMVVE